MLNYIALTIYSRHGVAVPFDVLTKEEAVERARISRRMLDKQIRAGKGPAVTRIGGAVRIRDDELQTWLERCTVPPPSVAAAA